MIFLFRARVLIAIHWKLLLKSKKIVCSDFYLFGAKFWRQENDLRSASSFSSNANISCNLEKNSLAALSRSRGRRFKTFLRFNLVSKLECFSPAPSNLV